MKRIIGYLSIAGFLASTSLFYPTQSTAANTEDPTKLLIGFGAVDSNDKNDRKILIDMEEALGMPVEVTNTPVRGGLASWKVLVAVNRCPI
jgi:tripartite-type tricarboxylate transporter receptor subunit TctC